MTELGAARRSHFALEETISEIRKDAMSENRPFTDSELLTMQECRKMQKQLQAQFPNYNLGLVPH